MIKKILLLIIPALIILIILAILLTRTNQKTIQTISTPTPIANNLESKTISIGGKKLLVEFATTPSAWQLGLGNRRQLDTNSGMLFLFPSSEIRDFWMKDTLIPLDIIWVNDRRVIGIARMFPELGVPAELLKHFYSPSQSDIVIETNLNWTTNNNINIGDIVDY